MPILTKAIIHHPPIFIDPSEHLDKILEGVASHIAPDADFALTGENEEGALMMNAQAGDIRLQIVRHVDGTDVVIRQQNLKYQILLQEDHTTYQASHLPFITTVYRDGRLVIRQNGLGHLDGSHASGVACSMMSAFVIKRSENTYTILDPNPTAFIGYTLNAITYHQYENKVILAGFVPVHLGNHKIWI